MTKATPKVQNKSKLLPNISLRTWFG